MNEGLKIVFRRGLEGQSSKIHLFPDRYHSNKIKIFPSSCKTKINRRGKNNKVIFSFFTHS